MADDQALSAQDIKDLQEITSRLPAGHPMQKKISILLNSQPTQFEKERAPGYQSPEDIEFAKTIGLKPTDIKGVTDAAMLGVGGGGIGRAIAQRGIKAAIKPLIKGFVGATAGGATGHYLGKMVGMPEAGAAIGALGGGLMGGMGGEPEKLPTPEPFPPEATTTGRPSMTSPVGQTQLRPTPIPTKPVATSPFSGMTSSAVPIGNAELPPVPRGQPVPIETLRRGGMPAPPTPEGTTAPSNESGIPTFGKTLYKMGQEPNLNNPSDVKVLKVLQTRPGSILQTMANQGDRFAAYILRTMPRP